MTDEPPTHAGGVVVRRTRARTEFLLVRPSDGRDAWVLPKGHIDPGEDSEAAAVREVREEAGVAAAIEEPLGRTEQASRTGPARIDWYRMRYVGPAEPMEERETGWFALDEALVRATYESARDLLRAAAARVSRS